MDGARITIVNIGVLSSNRFWGETERLHVVSATCTLIETDGARIIVDPSPYPDELARKLFDTTGLRPGAIDMVYLTHPHGDHRFGIELFAGKPWLASAANLADWTARWPDERKIAEKFATAEEVLPRSVALFPSPGHTPGHTSLVLTADADRRLIVAGDAVMTREFFEAEEGFHNSTDIAQAVDTIRRIKTAADLVVPGHGNVIVNTARKPLP